MACCFCALEGFLNANNLSEDPNIRLLVLFDNEEVGSSSLMGAGSTLISDVFSRLCKNAEYERISRRKSMVLSCVCILGSSHSGHGSCSPP